MKRKLSFLLAGIFLAMQLFAFQHMAEHGFAQHKHAGKTCEISAYFQSSQGFDSKANVPFVTAFISEQSTSFAPVSEEIKTFLFGYNYPARAPPKFS